MTPTQEKARQIQGPVLVLGASGFIGANLLRSLLSAREDAYGTYLHSPAWRLEDLPSANVIQTDLLVDANLDHLLGSLKPKTVLNCVAYGAYSFETDSHLIYQTNFGLAERLVRRLQPLGISAYVHAGSSSEYGDHASGPAESDLPEPNSDYAVSKVAASSLLSFYGKKREFPCANLRLYSVYGPLEDSSRLIPQLVAAGVEGRYPEFVDPDIARDFVYVDDAVEAFLDAALYLRPEDYGSSFNIGSGKKTTIRQVAETAAEVFGIEQTPTFQTMPNRNWDLSNWYADTRKAKAILGWGARTAFAEGLRSTSAWYRTLDDRRKYEQSSKRFELDSRHSVSAVIACYKDGQAIPQMYERLKRTFDRIGVDYEIIFVNDNSPDDSEAVIQELTRRDRRVLGISHSRNFGSQAAFRSGLEISTKNSCVLLDGDLQDPPELIEPFVEKWREGYDVVFGRRVKREASLFMQVAYKLFYRIFRYFSYVPIPRDAGDFSLIDRRAVRAILQFPESDFFLSGVRAYVGYRQTGVDYVRAERAFGRSTNNLFKNIDWAKKGILSYSHTPLTILSYAGTLLFLVSGFLLVAQVALRLLFPDLAPRGATTILVTILFFGSINLFALAILGEYIAKIFEEVKQRPHFVRRSIIRNGEVRFFGEVR